MRGKLTRRLKVCIWYHARKCWRWLVDQIHNPLKPGESDRIDPVALALAFLFLVIWALAGPRLAR